VGAGPAGAGCLDRGCLKAGVGGQGMGDLEQVTQLLKQLGWAAGAGGLARLLQQLGAEPGAVLGCVRRICAVDAGDAILLQRRAGDGLLASWMEGVP
jgi:hypothetical protein